MSGFRTLLATWFGSGFFPFASGTAGTIATIPLVLLLWRGGSVSLHMAAATAVFFTGVWASNDAETRFGRKDPGQVVIDEAAGFLLATVMIPASAVSLAVAFFAFRAFDIFKPWPARRLEDLPRGWGIMLDDVFAGLYANLFVQLVFRLGGALR